MRSLCFVFLRTLLQALLSTASRRSLFTIPLYYDTHHVRLSPEDQVYIPTNAKRKAVVSNLLNQPEARRNEWRGLITASQKMPFLISIVLFPPFPVLPLKFVTAFELLRGPKQAES
jgi:hypothetical protein